MAAFMLIVFIGVTQLPLLHRFDMALPALDGAFLALPVGAGVSRFQEQRPWFLLTIHSRDPVPRWLLANSLTITVPMLAGFLSVLYR